MPIMARTSGGIYTPVTSIYDTAGNTISTVYDNAGNTVFSSIPSETERLAFKDTSNSAVNSLSRRNLVTASSRLSLSSSVSIIPLCQLIEGKYPIISLREYKGWKLRGTIYIMSTSNAKPEIEVKIGLTNVSSSSSTADFYSLLDLGTFRAYNTQSIDLELPDLANYYNYNLAMRVYYYPVSWYNSTGKSQSVICGVSLNPDHALLKLYKT